MRTKKRILAFILSVSVLLGLLLLPTQAATPTSLTIQELASAASSNAGAMETAIRQGTKEANGSYSKFSFPASFTVGSYTVDAASYTLMAARAVHALGQGKAATTAISYTKTNFGADQVSCSPVNTINKGQYLDLAERVIIYAEATGGSLPTSFNAPTDGFSDFKGNICIYSVAHILAEVLQSYASSSKLPDSVSFIATNCKGTTTGSTTNTTSDWFANVIAAAANVKAGMDSKVIPSSIKVGTVSVTPGQFQYLACKVVVALNAGQTTGTLTVPKVSEPENPSGSATGQVYREDYVAMAQKIITFIDTNALAPNYSTSSTIGQMHYYDVIHMYAKILNYYKENGTLPNYNTSEGWTGSVGTVTTPTTAPTTASTASTAPTTGEKDSYANVVKASVALVDYIKSNKNMPSKITVGTHSCTPAQYLYMATQVIVGLNKGITSGELSIPSYKEPSNPSESVAAGSLKISEIVTMAGKVVPFMEANGQGPNYMTSSLGTLHYYGGIYLYAQVLSYYCSNSKLPDSISIETWFKTTGGKAGDATFGQDFSAYAKYLVPTRNCQSTNATIISVAKTGMMYSNGGYTSPTNTYQAMWNLEKYLNHNTSYIYYANTYRGALGVWRDKGGNCCDMAHLAIACARALGVPGQYMHGYCIFATMSTGHVYARVYCGASKGWQIIDTVSNSNYLGYKTNRTAELWNTYAELPF